MSLSPLLQPQQAIRHPHLPFALAMLIAVTGWWVATANQHAATVLGKQAELILSAQHQQWQQSQLALESELHAARVALQQRTAELEQQRIAAAAEAEAMRKTVQRQSLALQGTVRELKHLRAEIVSRPASSMPLGHEWMKNQSEAEKRYMLSALPSGAPIANPEITSHYGKRVHPVTGKRKKHAGIDFRAAIGTPVYATADGVVEWSGKHPSGLGTMIKLVHGYGFTTSYSHLSRTTVKTRQFVSRGDLIGYSGNTGLSSAPHLHYEVSHLYRQLDPKVFVNWSMDNYTEVFARYPQIRWRQLAQSVRGRIGVEPQVFARAELAADVNSG